VGGPADGTDGPAADVDAATDDDRPRLVLVTLGGRRALIPVESVLEVLVDAAITRLPGSVPAVRGVTSVRGRIVAVVDPRTTPAPTGDGHLLVVSTPTGPVALAVDHVHAVVPADAEAPGPIADGAGPPPDRRATLEGGESLEVVDPVHLLAGALGEPTAAADPVGAPR
jgi:purine-binding chemotaxis protein CheW